MTTDTHITSTTRRASGDTARTVLAAGGLLAAFGVASCCALPVALSMLGIGAASLVGIGYLAASYQRELLLAATLCLAAVAFLSWRRWRVRANGSCAIAPTRIQAVTSWLSLASVVAAVALIALTFWIEPPL
jgi:mercuric ion transport protein